MHRPLGLLAACALGLFSCGDAPRPLAVAGKPHVLFLHLDGYRADLTRSLLERGRLPYLGELAARGRISFEATTVDKSETMKVIQSYLTSRLESPVVGWWQFDRSDFRFRNYWLDPAEVLSYALGPRFPRSPTIQDFLAARGENLVAAMSLARRGVRFDHYGRAYLEGIEAVGAHTYLRQAHATMESFLSVNRRIEERSEPAPALSTLLLAAADELSHAEGVSDATEDGERCFRRGEETDDTPFRLLEEDEEHPLGGALRGLEGRYFTSVRRTLLGRIQEVCIEVPWLEGSEEEPRRRAHPRTVLAMLVQDIELGYLLESYRRSGPAGRSLFDRTLFLLFGDHGMVETPNGMTGREGFLGSLNRRLALDSGAGARSLPAGAELGIDDRHLPQRLAHPELFLDWQPEEVRRLTGEARLWSQDFVRELRELLREDLHQSYWWLFFLRSLLIDPKLDGAMTPFAEEAASLFRKLYLRSVPLYLQAEREASRSFFDRHVRLVYGGGALNNAELFLPAGGGEAGFSWGRRPSYAEIVSHRGGSRSTTALLEALREHEAVGLLFLRRQNELFSESLPLPERAEIEVQDRENNRGVITVRAEPRTGELVFHYRTDPESERDPLGYERWGRGKGSFGTYHEWNDRTVDSEYVNAVGGMGAYLYSNNPAIGDVVLMHRSGWNFGDNRGGHGGLHREEKTTFLLASGPGIQPGELRSQGRFRTGSNGDLEHTAAAFHRPTLLDLAPTALHWLGYRREDFERFGREEFPSYLDDWIRSQRAEILAHLDGMSTLDQVREKAGVEELSLEPLLPRIARLLAFLDADREKTLELLEAGPMMGNPLVLR